MQEEATLDLAERLRNKIGRPSRVHSIAVRFTEDEVQLLNTTARSQNTTHREWAREVLLREARKPKDDMLFTEMMAIRLFLLNLLKPLALGRTITDQDWQSISTQVQTNKRLVAREIAQQYKDTPTKETR